jgi:ADP-ribosyl-[dinitrogen reductase] hydrolase
MTVDDRAESTLHDDSAFLLDRALGAYLGFACGDALGATVEFMSPRAIQQRYGLHKDIIGGGWLGLPPGDVTDDTQMSLALGHAILAHRDWNLVAVADAFLRWMNTFPPDVGNTCRRGISRYRTTGELSGPVREDEAGNGALMRNLPVVLATLNHPAQFERMTLEQSHLTHNHPLSDAGALMMGELVQALLHGQSMDECKQRLAGWIEKFPAFIYQPYRGRASGYVVDTVQTVLHYFFVSEDLESCVINTVNQGGDADTTGALAGMLAGARYGTRAIPARWLHALNAKVVEDIRAQTVGLLQWGLLP